MAQTRSFEYKADDLTIDLDHWHHGIIMPGVYQGFDFGTQTDMNLIIVHSVTGTKVVNKSPTAESNFIGVVKTRQGVIVKEDEPISPIPISTAHATLPRIDLIYMTHEYIDSEGGQPAYYGVIEGTPDANPVAPSVPNALTDTIIATLYVPAAITDLSDADVVYTRAEVPTIANENYAHRDKVNRFTKQEQAAPENSAITFDTGTNELTLNSESNLYALPNTITVAEPLTKISAKPAGTYIKLRVMTTDGITVTHDATPGSGEIFNEVDEETLVFPKGTILDFVAQSDESWMLIDYSLKPVWNRTNNFSKLQQHSYGSGVRLKYITYVISSITYNKWIFEIDASAENHVFDLSNADQLNGFVIGSSGFVELGVIEIVNGFKTINSGLGNGSKINIKFIGVVDTPPSVVLAGAFSSHPLPVQTGNYIYNDNKSNLVGVCAFDGGTPIFELASITNLDNATCSIDISIMNLNKFHLFLSSALSRTLGGRSYTNASFYLLGASHREALDALATALDNLAPQLTPNASWTSNCTVISDCSGLSVLLEYVVLGKMVFFDFTISLAATAASGVDIFIFEATVPTGTIKTGQGRLGIGSGQVGGSDYEYSINLFANTGSANNKIRISGEYDSDGTSKVVSGRVKGFYVLN